MFFLSLHLKYQFDDVNFATTLLQGLLDEDSIVARFYDVVTSDQFSVHIGATFKFAHRKLTVGKFTTRSTLFPSPVPRPASLM